LREIAPEGFVVKKNKPRFFFSISIRGMLAPVETARESGFSGRSVVSNQRVQTQRLRRRYDYRDWRVSIEVTADVDPNRLSWFSVVGIKTKAKR
jgi:hypothetical protein